MCYCPVRVLILVIALCTVTLLISNVLIFNFTVLCMLDEQHYPRCHEAAGKKGESPPVVTHDVEKKSTGQFSPLTTTSFPEMAFKISQQSFLSPGVSSAAEEKISDAKDDFSAPRANDTLTNLTELNLLLALKQTGSRDTEIEPPEQFLLMCNSETFVFNGSDIKFRWTKDYRTMAFSSFAWGALIGVLPYSWLLQKYGARSVLFSVGVLSSLATVVSPIAAHYGPIYFICCRVVQGFGFTAVLPTVGAVTAHWAPLSESGIFMGILIASLELAPAFTMPISGLLCSSSIGWPTVYYIHGSVTLLLLVIWALFYRNNPRKHPQMTGLELDQILAGKALAGKRTEQVIPWKKLFSSLAIWAIIIASFGNMCGINVLLYYTPTYLKKVLDFKILTSGLLAALPTLAQCLVKIFAGATSDLTPCSANLKVRIFNSIAFFGMAAFLVALGFIPQEFPKLAFVVLICAISVLGFNVGGFLKSASLVAREYSPIVFGAIMVVNCVILIVIPYLVHEFVPTGGILEWRLVFLVLAGILGVCGLVFAFLGSGSPASWTRGIQRRIHDSQNFDDNISIEAGILEMRVLPPKKPPRFT